MEPVGQPEQMESFLSRWLQAADLGAFSLGECRAEQMRTALDRLTAARTEGGGEALARRSAPLALSISGAAQRILSLHAGKD
jgi:hypothetical protein